MVQAIPEDTMKRFLVFSGYDYYPCGGWDDFLGAFDSIEEARAAAAKEAPSNWTQIVDLQSGEKV